MNNRPISPEQAAALAGESFGECWHCAESVTKAVLEAVGHASEDAVACATAFGGGFGRSFEEACGALSGGLVAIGMQHGRRESGVTWDLAAELAAELRRGFVQRHGTTHCATLRKRFGDEAQMDECRNLVRLVTADTLALLHDAADGQNPLQEVPDHATVG